MFFSLRSAVSWMFVKDKVLLLGLLIALGVIVADQLSKYYILNVFLGLNSYVSFGDYFNIVRAWNTGVSFSMFSNLGVNGVFILSAFSLCVVVFLVYWLNKE